MTRRVVEQTGIKQRAAYRIIYVYVYSHQGRGREGRKTGSGDVKRQSYKRLNPEIVDGNSAW